jgi:hypothetical protein
MTEFTESSRPRSAIISAVIALLFGLLTLKSGGSVLFVNGPARAAAGNYVPFVLWFNFIAGFVYIIAGVGLYLWQGWAVKLSLLIAIATMVVFAALGLYIVFGDGHYELRTIGAMILRSVLWLIIGLLMQRAWSKKTFIPLDPIPKLEL